MNKKELVSEGYEAPRVEVIEVEVEKGFTASLDGYGYGGHLGNNNQ